MIPPRSEAPEMLATKLAGTVMIETKKSKTAVTTTVVAREIAEVVPKRPFYIMLSNMRIRL